MDSSYSFKKENKIKYYYRILLYTISLHIIGLIGYLYFRNINNEQLIIYISLGVFFGWLLVFAFPLFVLYYNHKKYSNEVYFEVKGKFFKYQKVDKIVSFTFDDIEKVELWLTPPAYDKRTDWLFFGKYHFTRIYTKHNQIINISCIVFDETEEYFSEELIKRKKKFFPLMQKNQI